MVKKDSWFESDLFPESRWGLVEVTTDLPEIPDSPYPVASMFADRAWFELGHLKPGEHCKLTGMYCARFVKIEENTLVCVLPDGRTGVYTHDSDYNWETRRLDAEAKATRLFEGGTLNG